MDGIPFWEDMRVWAIIAYLVLFLLGWWAYQYWPHLWVFLPALTVFLIFLMLIVVGKIYGRFG